MSRSWRDPDTGQHHSYLVDPQATLYVRAGREALLERNANEAAVAKATAELVVELTKHADQMADILEKLVNCQIIEAEGWKLEEEAWNAAKAYRGFVGEC